MKKTSRLSPSFQLGVSLFFLLLLSPSGNEMEARRASEEFPPLVSLCDLLREPAAYAGKTITVAAHVSPTKEGTRLWNPDCPKLGVRLHIDREAKNGKGIDALYQEWDKHRPFIATLTGIYDPDYFDPIRHVKYAVFIALAAKDIERPAKE